LLRPRLAGFLGSSGFTLDALGERQKLGYQVEQSGPRVTILQRAGDLLQSLAAFRYCLAVSVIVRRLSAPVQKSRPPKSLPLWIAPES
jgi:hypothetical protein